MRTYLLGIVLGLGIAVLGAVLNQPAIVILGLIFGVFAVTIAAIQKTQEMREDIAEDLSPESRILLRPLRKLYEQMQEAAEGKEQALSAYLATEAMQESKRLLDQSATALKLRDRLLKESRGAYAAQKNADELQARLSTATSEQERASLGSALEARRQEMEHYASIREGVAKIESSVRQAEAAMAEMRARLASSGASGLADQGTDSLREAVGRMQSLSTSLSEAQQMLQQP